MTQGRRPRPGPPPARPRRRPRGRSLRGASGLRLRVGFVLIAMVVSVFAARLFQLQGVDAKAYVARAEAEGVVTLTLPANRGDITDRNGTPLAQSADGLMIVADPTLTSRNASAIATILARRLDVDYFDMLNRLRMPDTHFQYLARRVPATQARAVVNELDARGYKGIDTRRDPIRTYPAHDVAANILGFMNDQGQAGEGTELMFDNVLKGRDGTETYEQGGGNRIPLGDNSEVPPKPGRSVALTIDRDVQWYAQRALRDAVQGSDSDSGSAVVMDTHTGQLLALADYPTFDPDRPSLSSAQDLGSRAVRDAYEPGSVEKILTTSALLDAHKVTPRTQIVVPSGVRSSDHVIHDDYSHGTLHLPLTGVLAKSSNIGTVLAARQFSAKQLYDYLRKFGLGDRTGLGVQGESAGVLPDWRSWRQINKDTIAFGQGVAVTAVQMAAAVNAIANGGVWVEPSLVKGRVTDAQGLVVGSATAQRHRVVSAQAATEEARMLEAVVGPGGTAPMAAIPGYRVAGKTGTAQRVNPKCHCYDGTRTVSFAGFAPADAPRFVVYVVVQHPRNGGFGGNTAGPVFRRIMSYLLQKYAVPPTGTKAPAQKLEW